MSPESHMMWPYSFFVLTEIVLSRFQRTQSQCSIVVIFGLKRADCTDKGLLAVPRSLSVDVNVLLFSGNALSKLEIDEFRQYHSLQEIYLVQNRITIIAPDAFRGLYNLQILDLQANQLGSIPTAAFQHLPSVRILIMRMNPIKLLTPDSFRGLVKIEVLNFETCLLQRIHHHAFRGLNKLNEINLVNNQLHGLSETMAEFLPSSLTILRLHRNPWNCDCRLRWLRRWLSSSFINWDFASNSPVCVEPKLLVDISWKHLGWERFACPSVIVNTVTSVRVQPGTNASVECIALGDPEPQITWTRNAKPLPIAAISHNFESNDVGDRQMRSAILIRNATKRDVGDYKCTAENSAGRSEVTYKVWMEEEEQVPLLGNFTAGMIRREDIIYLGASVGTVFLFAVVILAVVFVIRRKRVQNQTYKIKNLQSGLKETISIEQSRTTTRVSNAGLSTEKSLLAEESSMGLLDPANDDCDPSSIPLQYRSPEEVRKYEVQNIEGSDSDPSDATGRCLQKFFGRLKERKSAKEHPSSSPIDVFFIRTENGGRCEFTPDILRCELNLQSLQNETEGLPTIPEDDDADDDVDGNNIDYVNSCITNDECGIAVCGVAFQTFTTRRLERQDDDDNDDDDDAVAAAAATTDTVRKSVGRVYEAELLTSSVVHNPPQNKCFFTNMMTVSTSTVSTAAPSDNDELSDEDQAPLKGERESSTTTFHPGPSRYSFQTRESVIAVETRFKDGVSVATAHDQKTNSSNQSGSPPSQNINIRVSSHGLVLEQDTALHNNGSQFRVPGETAAIAAMRNTTSLCEKSRDGGARIASAYKTAGPLDFEMTGHVPHINSAHNCDADCGRGGGCGGDIKGLVRYIGTGIVNRPKPGQRDSFGTTV